MSSKQHWDSRFDNKNDSSLGWYEKDLGQTLKFIDISSLSEESSVFVSGVGTSQLADLLVDTGAHIYLNDISETAVMRTSSRLTGDNFETIVADISLPLPRDILVDYWVDRAVLHFLLNEQQIDGYFSNLKNAVRIGGKVLLAQFSKTGATRCAGLDIRQYSIDDMQDYLGDEFVLLATEDYQFINPYGESRPYIYGLFERV